MRTIQVIFVALLAVAAAVAKDKPDTVLAASCGSVVQVAAPKIAFERKWTAIGYPLPDHKTWTLAVFEEANMGKMVAAGVAAGGLGILMTGPKKGRILLEQSDPATCTVTGVQGKPAKAMLKALQAAKGGN
jgi:hypothetical protein